MLNNAFSGIKLTITLTGQVLMPKPPSSVTATGGLGWISIPLLDVHSISKLMALELQPATLLKHKQSIHQFLVPRSQATCTRSSSEA